LLAQEIIGIWLTFSTSPIIGQALKRPATEKTSTLKVLFSVSLADFAVWQPDNLLSGGKTDRLGVWKFP
jgi:hypothetical protein